ncbi:RNA exonuclease 4 isoform X2 [Equus asinus]|uniref:RNA exonuclease 4 isoform X2 n=1 Tax=Equus asinus TaxID=9793 RepID=UPI0038F6FC3A
MGAGGGPRAGRAGGAGRRPRRGRRAPASGPGVPARRRGGDGGTGQGGPPAGPGLAEKLIRKKSKKKRLCHSKAREVRGKPGSGPGGAVVRPPKAPEDFSPNWKALQELLKQKPQTLEKPLVISQMDSEKQPQIIQQNREASPGKAKRDETGAKKAEHAASGGSAPSGAPAKASRAEHSEKGTKRRTNGDISLTQGDIKHKKRKAKEAAVALAPAPPTEEDIWFDDVDPADIEAAIGPEAAEIARKQLGQSKKSVTLVKEQAFSGLTKALALDCEMVGVGPSGEESIAARVSVVNQYGKCVYDKYVKPTQPVTDYRTAVSGIRPEHLRQGEEFEVVQKEVADMLRGRILVGHALHNDLKSGRPSLKLLAEEILGIRVQQAEHCSIQDAQAAMRLYVMVKKEWETVARDRRPAAAAPAHGSDDI